ncbi:MAG: hypothetical protein HYV60_07625, partial [Planctomycetia bacterium]|nr:hypothetical protein [Planctomycetia bacterium]
MLDVLTQVVDWFGDWDTTALRQPIPLTSGHPLSELVDYASLFQAELVTPLLDENAQPTFATVQDFSNRLAEELGLTLAEVNVSYQPSADQLAFHVSIGRHAFRSIDLPLTWQSEIHPLVLAASAGTVSAAAKSESLSFDIVLDLAPFIATMVGRNTLPANGQLSSDAHFDVLVNGTESAAVVVPRDATNQTPEDLIADLNAAILVSGGLPLRADLVDGYVRLRATGVRDTATLLVQAAVTDSAVTELGLAIPVGPSNPERALSLLSISHDMRSAGRYGFVEVSSAGGAATAIGSLQFYSPVGSPTTLTEHLKRFAAPTAGWETLANGSAELRLPLSVKDGLIPLPGLFPRFEVEMNDLFGVSTSTVALLDAASIDRLSELKFRDVLGALRQAGDVVTAMLRHADANRSIPFTRLSAASLTQLGSVLNRDLNSFASAESASLQQVVTGLRESLRLDAADLVVAFPEDGDMRFTIQYDAPTTTSTEALQVDLNAMTGTTSDVAKLEDVGRLYEARTRSLRVDGHGFGNLVFGLDVVAGATPTAYVHDDTAVNLEFRMSNADLDSAANVGPLAMFIVDGAVQVDGGGNRPAAIALTLAPDPDQKRTAAELQPGSIEATSTGSASARLPLARPTRTALLSPVLSITYPGLASAGVVASTPDLAALRRSVDVLADQSALPGIIRSYFQTLQSSLDASVAEVTQPIVGDALRDMNILAELGEQMATALEDHFATYGKSWDDVKQVLLKFGLQPVGEGEHNDPSVIWIRGLTSTLPTRVQQHPLVSGVPGLSSSANAVLVGGGSVTMSIGVNPFSGNTIFDLTGTDEVQLELLGFVPELNQADPILGRQGDMTVGYQDDLRMLTRSTRYPPNAAAPPGRQCTTATGQPTTGHCYRLHFEQGEPIFVVAMPAADFQPRISIRTANGVPILMPQGATPTTFANSSEPGQPVVFGGRNVVAAQSGEYIIQVDTWSNTSGDYALFLPSTRIIESVRIDLGEIGGDDYLHANSELPPGVTVADIKANPELAPIRHTKLDGQSVFRVNVSADMLTGFNQLSRPGLEIPAGHSGSVARTVDLQRQAGYSRATIDAGLLYAALSGTIPSD